MLTSQRKALVRLASPPVGTLCSVGTWVIGPWLSQPFLASLPSLGSPPLSLLGILSSLELRGRGHPLRPLATFSAGKPIITQPLFLPLAAECCWREHHSWRLASGLSWSSGPFGSCFPGLSTSSSFLALYWLFQRLTAVPKRSYFYSPPSQPSTPTSLRVHVPPETAILPALRH